MQTELRNENIDID